MTYRSEIVGGYGSEVAAGLHVGDVVTIDGQSGRHVLLGGAGGGRAYVTPIEMFYRRALANEAAAEARASAAHKTPVEMFDRDAIAKKAAALFSRLGVAAGSGEERKHRHSHRAKAKHKVKRHASKHDKSRHHKSKHRHSHSKERHAATSHASLAARLERLERREAKRTARKHRHGHKAKPAHHATSEDKARICHLTGVTREQVRATAAARGPHLMETTEHDERRARKIARRNARHLETLAASATCASAAAALRQGAERYKRIAAGEAW